MYSCQSYINFVHYRLHKLNIEQKYDIATRELDELYDEMKKTAEEREKVIDHHKVNTHSIIIYWKNVSLAYNDIYRL